MTAVVAAGGALALAACDLGEDAVLYPLPYAGEVEVADLDGDGALDVLALRNDGGETALLNDGAGTLTPVTTASEIVAERFVVADADGDGIPDLLTMRFGSETALQRGDGAGGFAPHEVVSTTSNTSDIGAGDLNGDGAADLLGVSLFAGLEVRLSDGAGGFGAPTVIPLTEPGEQYMASDIQVVDVDGDGDRDVVAVGFIGVRRFVTVLRGDGTGALGAATHTVGPESTPAQLVVADVDHDGDLDAVTGNDGVISFMAGDGTGDFAVPVETEVDSTFVVRASGDVDGDGHLDVVGTNYQSSNVKVVYGDGTGAFGDEHALGSGGEPTPYMTVAVGDLDGTGTPDVVLGDVSTDDGFQDNVSVLLNTLGRRHH